MALIAVSASLLAATCWLATTADGFAWLTRTLSVLSQERLKFEGVEGDLGGTLGIRKLTLNSDMRRIEIAHLRLEWQPRALWNRSIEIDLLAAQSMRLVMLKPDATPPALPRSLRLPLDLHARVLDLAELEILQRGLSLRFTQLRASLDGRGDRYRLVLDSATSPWAQAQGEIAVGKDAPFSLRGGMDAYSQSPLRLQMTTKVEGTLSAPQFSIDAHAAGMSCMVRGEAAPFAAVRLTRLLAVGEGIDPSRFVAGAPHADLAFSGLFEGRLEREPAGKPASESLFGTFSLSNGQAGRLDQQRLPLRSLTGAVLGDSVRAEFSELLLDLSDAGQFRGSGMWREGRLKLDISSPGLNLAGFHRAFNPTRIHADLQLVGDAKRQQLSAKVSETWGRGRFELIHADNVLRLSALDFSGQAGRLAAEGEFDFAAGQAFSAKFDAERINPARFGRFPVAHLNARGRIDGALQPDWRLQAEFTLPPGELEGRRVQGHGRMRYESGHLADAELDLDLAGNRMNLRGALGQVGDRLEWNIKAPELARLNLGLAGRLNSVGSLVGGVDDNRMLPQIEAEIAADGLRLPGELVADALNLKLDLQAHAKGVFNGQLDARGVQFGGQRLSQLRAAVQGRRDAHALTLDVRRDDARLTAALTGGLDAQQVWRGNLNHAELTGAWPMHLLSPAPLVLSRDRQQVENLALTLAGGELMLAQFSRDGGQFFSRGTLTNLPLAPWLGLLTAPPPLSTDLRFDGDWNLRLAETLDGDVHLRRHSGDLRLQDPALSLGLSAVSLKLNMAANRLVAKIEALSTEAGKLSADGQVMLQRDGAAFSLPRSVPLQWNLQLAAPDLRLARPFLPPGMRADAQLDVQMHGSGSLADPRVDGRIDASRIRLSLPEEGLAISDGRVGIDLADDRLRVREGVLIGGGQVILRGEAQWGNLLSQPQSRLELDFDRFVVSNRGDRRIIVSGKTRLNVDQQRLKLDGELTADRARVEMPEAGRPELASDVIVLGQPERQKSASRRYPLALDLKLDLGKDFLFKGAGLDVRLGGKLRVFTVNEVLRGEGGIQVEDGRYAAYGQSLDIERGILRFIGPIDNPGLDVLAVRKTASVTAGVQVRGTVRRPVVTLYSDPVLPDTEKLAWLVLGHGLDSGGQQEFALLQIAAGALLGQAESVGFQSRLAEALHIDTFDVRAGDGQDLASSVVSVGKRLSSRTLLSYEQSLDGLSQIVKVIYQLNPRVRFEAQAGQQQNSFDAFYTREYD